MIQGSNDRSIEVTPISTGDNTMHIRGYIDRMPHYGCNMTTLKGIELIREILDAIEFSLAAGDN